MIYSHSQQLKVKTLPKFQISSRKHFSSELTQTKAKAVRQILNDNLQDNGVTKGLFKYLFNSYSDFSIPCCIHVSFDNKIHIKCNV